MTVHIKQCMDYSTFITRQMFKEPSAKLNETGIFLNNTISIIQTSIV